MIHFLVFFREKGVYFSALPNRTASFEMEFPDQAESIQYLEARYVRQMFSREFLIRAWEDIVEAVQR